MLLTEKKGSGGDKAKRYIHIHSGVGKEIILQCSVSIVIVNLCRGSIRRSEYINERIVDIRMTIKGFVVIVLGVYVPNEDATEATNDAFHGASR